MFFHLNCPLTTLPDPTPLRLHHQSGCWECEVSYGVCKGETLCLGLVICLHLVKLLAVTPVENGFQEHDAGLSQHRPGTGRAGIWTTRSVAHSTQTHVGLKCVEPEDSLWNRQSQRHRIM